MASSLALLNALADTARSWRDPFYPRRRQAVAQALEAPNRFTVEAVAFAVNQQMHGLTIEAMQPWTGTRGPSAQRVIGVLDDASIPLAGLHDMLAVLLTGHRYLGTTDAEASALLAAFVEDVRQRLPTLAAAFGPVEQIWAQAEVLLATVEEDQRVDLEVRCDEQGLPPSRRLLRPRRYGVAVIDGREAEGERDGLAEDVLLHEGMGPHNVALLWAPEDVTPDVYLESFAAFRGVFPVHPDTPGALRMQQAFLAAGSQPHAYGEGLEFLVSKGPATVQGPGHVRWVSYARLEEVADWLTQHVAEVQLLAARPALAARLPDTLPFVAPGDAHRAAFGSVPACIDTLAFLKNLC